jgi:hypothetical protein
MSKRVVPAATETVALSLFPETLIPGAGAPSQPPPTSHFPSNFGQVFPAAGPANA